MDTDDQTPMPGRKVSAGEATALIDRFRTRFRVNSDVADARVPTWVAFPPDSYRSDEAILDNSVVNAQSTLLFFNENARELYRATPAEIRHYIRTRNPWEDYDVYIIDPAVSWTIAFTHELMHGSGVIIAGDFPSSTTG